MQIRCYNCHKPFAIGREAIHAALDTATAERLNHYNAYCPHCKRANRVSIEELRRSAPDWKPSQTEAEPEETKSE